MGIDLSYNNPTTEGIADMQVWKIGTDVIPNSVLGRPRFFPEMERSMWVGEGVWNREGQYIVEEENGDLRFSETDPRIVEEPAIEWTPEPAEKVKVLA